jgi:hypothetical protein
MFLNTSLIEFDGQLEIMASFFMAVLNVGAS